MEGKLVVAVNAGGGAVTLDGVNFIADQYSTGGTPGATTDPITGATSAGATTLLQTERWGKYRYEVPVSSASYDVKLFFSELFHTQPGARLFSLDVEGQPLLSNADLVDLAGPKTAYSRVIKNVPVFDGSLTINLDAAVDNGTLSGFAIYSKTGTLEEPAVTCPATYKNPLLWEDLPDLDIIRVADTYYYSASSFHHSPGAPLLRSYDLVNWEYLSHSVPVMDFTPAYDLNGGRAYVNGIWASSLGYRNSNQTFYWMGCMHNAGGGWVFTAKSPQGPWEKHASQACYYDMGLLVDQDTDKLYVAWGNNTLNVAELSADGFKQVRNQVVYQTPSTLSGPLEGSRFYKINGNYYIFSTQYANGEYVLRSTNGPFGPYEMRPFAVKLPFAGSGAGGSPHQGGLVQTQTGDWYYLAFNDAYPAGRLPVMAPVTWSNGWPSVTLVNGQWGASYPFPNLPCGAEKVKPRPAKDTFSGTSLGAHWQWNHNPDNSKWAMGNGLTLRTATVTNDFYAARNTLTQRIEGPASTATIELDYSAMANGDVAGIAALRDISAWIGVKKSAGTTRVVMTSSVNMDTTWKTANTGVEVASAPISGGKIWLRVQADVRTTSGGGQARFFYSTDGNSFVPLGNTLTMTRDWQYFLGYRFGLFNYATSALGGSVRVNGFAVAKP